MIIRQLEKLKGTERSVSDANWTSYRLLLESDGMGFSLHDTTLHAGTETAMWYRNHVEAVYCIEGDGEIHDLETGEVHPISPGTMYALDKHDQHILKARTRFRMICVFNPPLHGPETHDEDGAYPLLAAPDATAASRGGEA
ncbi:MAG: L-ectoine synthase [Planctomycetota bacterium]|jgi:L-ectoine synthase